MAYCGVRLKKVEKGIAARSHKNQQNNQKFSRSIHFLVRRFFVLFVLSSYIFSFVEIKNRKVGKILLVY
jgi:hypothetical protein